MLIIKINIMAKYRIEFERERCIGATNCNDECSGNWQMQPDGKSSFNYKEFDDDKLECNMAAAKNCPVKAIHIYSNETNEKLI